MFWKPERLLQKETGRVLLSHSPPHTRAAGRVVLGVAAEMDKHWSKRLRKESDTWGRKEFLSLPLCFKPSINVAEATL